MTAPSARPPEALTPPRESGGRWRVALFVETSIIAGREILRGVQRFVDEAGDWTVTLEPRGLSELVPKWVGGWQGDGVLARIGSPKVAATMKKVGVPVVDVLGMVPEANFPLVHVDDRQLGAMGAKHLLRRPLRMIGFAGFCGERWSVLRGEACREVARTCGVPCTGLEIERAGRFSAKTQQQMTDWLRSLSAPGAVLACNDEMGLEVLQACSRAGIRVPHDLAVLGVDDDELLCGLASPPLSSIRAGHAEVGYRAAALLDGWMRSGATPVVPPVDGVRVLPEKMVVRGSSDWTVTVDEQVNEAIRFIRHHAHEPISVEEVARHCGKSRPVLQRHFGAALGVSIYQVIQEVRMEAASDLLLSTRLTLAEIAERCGYSQVEYFSTAFRKHMGLPPSEFRARG